MGKTNKIFLNLDFISQKKSMNKLGLSWAKLSPTKIWSKIQEGYKVLGRGIVI